MKELKNEQGKPNIKYNTLIRLQECKYKKEIRKLKYHVINQLINFLKVKLLFITKKQILERRI